jgi:hypothetical protein
VAQKIATADYTVQLSPEFQTATGKRYRVVIDGHHSLAAAIEGKRGARVRAGRTRRTATTATP